MDGKSDLKGALKRAGGFKMVPNIYTCTCTCVVRCIYRDIVHVHVHVHNVAHVHQRVVIESNFSRALKFRDKNNFNSPPHAIM